MKELLDEIYGCDSYELLSQATCGDALTNNERNFTLTNAAYAYLTNYSGGQDSPEYSQLSRLLNYFKPGLTAPCWETLESAERYLYCELAQYQCFTVRRTYTIEVEFTLYAKTEGRASKKADELKVSAFFDDDYGTEIDSDGSGLAIINVTSCELTSDHISENSQEFQKPEIENSDFEADEPETHGWIADGLGITLYDYPSGRDIFIQGEEGHALEEQLDNMSKQSHINHTISEYFSCVEPE